MIQFKENDTFAHSYLICRFDQCMLIDPSHDIEEIHKALDHRTLSGILLTHAHHDHVHLIGEVSNKKYMFIFWINTCYLKINIMDMHH